MGAQTHEMSIVKLAADYIRQRYHKPGNVFIGVVSRLDSVVSGVLVLARTSKAASRLSEQIRQQRTIKRYLALVDGLIDLSEPIPVRTFLRKNESKQRMDVFDIEVPGSQWSELNYQPIQQLADRFTLLNIELLTGRKHQIRAQWAHIGHPILGDQRYGARAAWSKPGIALSAVRLRFRHPTRDEVLEFTAPGPS